MSGGVWMKDMALLSHAISSIGFLPKVPFLVLNVSRVDYLISKADDTIKGVICLEDFVKGQVYTHKSKSFGTDV